MGIEEEVIGHYDAATRDYTFFSDHLHWGLFLEGETADSRAVIARAADRMTLAVANAAEIKPGSLVVDAGSGVGSTALLLAETFQCSVIGLNITQSQIEIARERVEGSGFGEQIAFVHADCSRSIPLPDESVDAIVTMECGVHLADRARFFAECRRVLRPGGRLSGEDWFVTEGLTDSEYSRFIQPICDAWIFPDIGSISSYVELLGAARLDVREAIDLGAQVQENIRVLDRIERLLRLAPRLRASRWRTMMPLLREAWQAGKFTLGRYVAVRADL